MISQALLPCKHCPGAIISYGNESPPWYCLVSICWPQASSGNSSPIRISSFWPFCSLFYPQLLQRFKITTCVQCGFSLKHQKRGCLRWQKWVNEGGEEEAPLFSQLKLVAFCSLCVKTRTMTVTKGLFILALKGHCHVKINDLKRFKCPSPWHLYHCRWHVFPVYMSPKSKGEDRLVCFTDTPLVTFASMFSHISAWLQCVWVADTRRECFSWNVNRNTNGN